MRAILVLMLILPAFLPAGLAQASGLSAPTDAGTAASMKNTLPQTQPVSRDRSRTQGDPLLDENFDYGGTAGNLTAISGGNWVAHSGGGTNPIQYAITSLSMPSYVSSGIAGSATFTSSGEDDEPYLYRAEHRKPCTLLLWSICPMLPLAAIISCTLKIRPLASRHVFSPGILLARCSLGSAPPAPPRTVQPISPTTPPTWW